MVYKLFCVIACAIAQGHEIGYNTYQSAVSSTIIPGTESGTNNIKPWTPGVLDRDDTSIRALIYLLFKCGENGLTFRKGGAARSFLSVVFDTLNILENTSTGRSDIAKFKSMIHRLRVQKEDENKAVNEKVYQHEVIIPEKEYEAYVRKLDILNVKCQKGKCDEIGANEIWQLLHTLSANGNYGSVEPRKMYHEMNNVLRVCLKPKEHPLWLCVHKPCDKINATLEDMFPADFTSTKGFEIWLLRIHNYMMSLGALQRAHDMSMDSASGELEKDVWYPTVEACESCRSSTSNFKITRNLLDKFGKGELSRDDLDAFGTLNEDETYGFLVKMFANKHWYQKGYTAKWINDHFVYIPIEVEQSKSPVKADINSVAAGV